MPEMIKRRDIFDSHAHYDDARFDSDRQELLEALPEKGVAAVMAVADTLESSLKCQELAKKYNYIWCSAGIHPHEAQNAGSDVEKHLSLFTLYEKCMAIGETGLDYHYDFSPREKQKEVFERHLSLAVQLDLPVIVHDREAHADTLALLKKYKPRGVVHCYTGSAEMIPELLRLGLYIGFTGVVTFKNARKPLEAAAVVPNDRILLETDCPYMTPVPFRGERCDSSMIPYTASAIARVKGLETEELLDLALKNACTLYGINLKPQAEIATVNHHHNTVSD